MTQELDTYPLLRKAILEMAYDNGIINRNETEEDFLTRINESVTGEEGFPEDELYEVETTLEKLSEQDVVELATGDSDQVIEDNPDVDLDHTSAILNKIFDML